MRSKVALLFLIAELSFIVLCKISPKLTSLWSPFHEVARFRIHAVVRNRRLDDKEIVKRYHFKNWLVRNGYYLETNSMQHVYDIMESVESNLSPEERAQIEVSSVVNGVVMPTWNF